MKAASNNWRPLSLEHVMSDDEHEEPGKRPKRWVWAVVVTVLYVLSIGPVGGTISTAVDRGLLSEKTIGVVVPIYRTVYGPLLWLAMKVPFVKDSVVWYVNLFN